MTLLKGFKLFQQWQQRRQSCVFFFRAVGTIQSAWSLKLGEARAVHHQRWYIQDESWWNPFGVDLDQCIFVHHGRHCRTIVQLEESLSLSGSLFAGSGSLFGTGSSASLFGSDAVAPLMCLQGRWRHAKTPQNCGLAFWYCFSCGTWLAKLRKWFTTVGTTVPRLFQCPEAASSSYQNTAGGLHSCCTESISNLHTDNHWCSMSKNWKVAHSLVLALHLCLELAQREKQRLPWERHRIVHSEAMLSLSCESCTKKQGFPCGGLLSIWGNGICRTSGDRLLLQSISWMAPRSTRVKVYLNLPKKGTPKFDGWSVDHFSHTVG